MINNRSLSYAQRKLHILTLRENSPVIWRGGAHFNVIITIWAPISNSVSSNILDPIIENPLE